MLVGVLAAPLVQAMLPQYTWRGMLTIKAALVLNLIPFGYFSSHFGTILEARKDYCLYTTKRLDSRESITTITFKSVLRVLCDTSLLFDHLFILYSLSCVGLYTVQILTMQFIVRYAQSIGIDDQTAASVMAVLLATSLLFFILVGILSVVGKLANIIAFFLLL